MTVCRDLLNGKASPTVTLSEVVETEMEIAIKHRRLLSCNFSVLCSKAHIFRNIICLFLSKGSNPQLVLESLCLNGLRIKLYNAWLLQSTHILFQWNPWRDQGVSLRTGNTKGPSLVSQWNLDGRRHHTCLTRVLHLLFLFLQMPVGKKNHITVKKAFRGRS